LPNGLNETLFPIMSMSTIKKKKHQVPSYRKKPVKVSKYAFGPAVRNIAAVVHTGIGDLSTREGLGD
jgi:hypothetical protein